MEALREDKESEMGITQRREEAAKQNALLKDGTVTEKRWRYKEGWREISKEEEREEKHGKRENNLLPLLNY